MNKNLKKVISAVAALAMSASSFVALAANYPDVDATASYKQAVDELSALQVINGYEDGTFQPDKLVSRAEFSKMVITALGSAELAQAEAAMNRDTAFSDVTASHWAAGYVTAAVSSSIINGMGDGTFAPDANVTYAQAMKMLVCAAGYEQWSVDRGGWPDGYMYWGNQLKVGSGVKDVTDNTEITRAQVAQMIDNILNAEICVDTHEYSYDQYGNRYPTLKQKAGTGTDFESILVKNHDAYKVKGTVMSTNKSTGGGINADEVTFQIQNAKRWLDLDYAITKDTNIDPIKANVGDTNVADYLKQYVEVLVQVDDDDEYTILSVASAGQTEEATVAAADYDEQKSGATPSTSEKLWFYANGKSTSYRINAKTEIYVNGVQMANFDKAVTDYVVNNTASDVTLIDVPESGSTDGYYDLVLVNAYDTAVVDSVDNLESDKPRINFIDASSITGGSIARLDVDTTDKNYTYTFTKDGAEIALADIQAYDVLSIKRDVTGGFGDSTFYEVIVSSKTDEGKYSTYDSEDNEYVINGTTYSVVGNVSNLDASTEYTLYLDAFGRIAYTDELAVNNKIGILDAVYTVRGSDTAVNLIAKDGTATEYLLRNVAGNDTAAYKIVYKDGTGANKEKNAIENRVVEYTVNASNEITIKDADTTTPAIDALTATPINGEFRASTDRINGFKLSADITSLLNIYDPDDIQPMSYSALVNERNYVTFGYDISKTDRVYRFVLVKNGSGEFSKDTQFAVYNKSVSTQNDNEENVTALELLVNGDIDQVIASDVMKSGSVAVSALNRGDLIVYETDNKGEINNIKKVSTLANFDTYQGIRAAAIDASVANSDALVDATVATALTTSDDKVEITFGAVVGKSGTSFDLSPIKAGITKETEVTNFSCGEDVKVYVLDFDQPKNTRLSVGSAGSISRVRVPQTDVYYNAARTEYNWGPTKADYISPNFAFVRTVNKEAKEVYVINPSATVTY